MRYDVNKPEKTPAKVHHQQPVGQISPPDGGWGWVVTFSAFMVGFILDGISFSFGVFFPKLVMHFNESKSLTSWIISVMNGTYLGIGPVASVLVTRFGCRKVAIFGAVLAAVAFFLSTFSPNVQTMIILYGLVGGGGLGLMYLPSIVIVGYYFTSKRALATGIAVCGSGIGGFVFAPMSEFLIEQFTWKGTMYFIAGIVLSGVIVCALFRPLTPDPNASSSEETGNETSANTKIDISIIAVSEVTEAQPTSASNGQRDCNERTDNHNPDQKNICESTTQPDHLSQNYSDKEKNTGCCDIASMFDFSLLRSPTFLVYGCSCFLCALGFYIPFTYIPDLALKMGLTSQQGAMLISIIGILNVVARVTVGWIADRSWANETIINCVALVVGGVSTVFVPFYNSFWILAVYSAVFGTCIAVFVSLRSIIMAELLGIEKLTSSFGLVVMCQGPSALIGAPLAGALSDMSDDYEGAFYMAGGAIALAGAICFPLRRIVLWENRHDNRGQSVTVTDSEVVIG